MLISDRAKAEISNKVKDLLNLLFIKAWQSEPHNKNQNFGERGWQDTQRCAMNLLNWSGAPTPCWLLALQYVCFVLNHVALERLGWRTPMEWLFGSTPDISMILVFVFYQPVYYALEDNAVAKGETNEALGRFVGFAEGVGHKMTFKILTNDGKILIRSRVRSANKEGAFEDFRALKVADEIRPGPILRAATDAFKDKSPRTIKGEVIIPETVDEEEDEVIKPETVDEDEEDTETDPGTSPSPHAKTSAHQAEINDNHANPNARPDEEYQGEWGVPVEGEDDYNWVKRVFKGVPSSTKDGIHRHTEDREPIIIEVKSLLKRSFTSNPTEDGEQFRATIEDITPTGDNTADDTQELYRFKARAGDKVFEEVMTYNQMLDWCDRDLGKDDFFNFKSIRGHRRDPSQRNKWQLRVEWESGEMTWEPFSMIFGDDSVTVSMYAKKHGMLEQWPRCKKFIKNDKVMARMAHQARLKNFRNRPVYKFGIQVPRNHHEAMMIDAKDGNDKWATSEALEVQQLDDYDSFEDLGKDAPIPEGYTKIRCHFVYDVKHDGRYKSRFVAGGHMTDTPNDSTYSGVVSIPGMRIVTFLAELNDLELWATGVGNAHLESVTKEKVAFVAGPEFGE